MSRFNTPSNTGYYTENLAGGKGFKLDPFTELAGIIFTSWSTDQFYRSYKDTESRLAELIVKCGPAYAAKCALIARKKYGLRSISHLVTAKIAQIQNLDRGVDWKSYYKKIIHRPDDITEILALVDCKVTAAMRKGFAARLGEFSEYQLAKYAKFGRERKVNLNDAMRICHPKRTDALEKLMYRTLKNTDTWEARGNSFETWRDLLKEKKLGYLALLRNLRNMAEWPELEPLIYEALIDEETIKKGMIFPFQFYKAHALLNRGLVRTGVEQAVELAMKNIPRFEGKTVILLDASGSMYSVRDTASMFAVALHRANEASIIVFDHAAQKIDLKKTGFFDQCTEVERSFQGSSTNFRAAYTYLRDHEIKCDRVVLISDMQHWVRGDSSHGSFLEWKDLTECDPEMWSIDLLGYGSAQLRPDRTHQLFGFSEKMFDIIPFLEQGDIKTYIEGTELC